MPKHTLPHEDVSLQEMPLPQEMNAIEIREPGGPDVLTPVKVPVPQPGPNEILVRVAGAGVNRPDVAQRQGLYPPPPGASPLPGLEIAGTVVVLGPGVKRFALGARVMGLVAGGGYAEYVVVNEDNALPVPNGLNIVEAAAIPETFFTVWSNVFQRGGLKSGETLLVHGGASGIGTTAIKIAHALGSKVIVTVGSDEKCAVCRELGADLAINYKTQDFVTEVNKFTKEKGVDVILDMVGGDYTERNLKIAAVEGRIVQIAFLQGHKVTVNLNLIMTKRLVLTGSTLRARDVAFKAKIAEELQEKVFPLIESGQIRPVIDDILPLNEAVKAHERMEKSDHIGKIVLKVN